MLCITQMLMDHIREIYKM